jgi:hypothetical protein
MRACVYVHLSMCAVCARWYVRSAHVTRVHVTADRCGGDEMSTPTNIEEREEREREKIELTLAVISDRVRCNSDLAHVSGSARTMEKGETCEERNETVE